MAGHPPVFRPDVATDTSPHPAVVDRYVAGNDTDSNHAFH